MPVLASALLACPLVPSASARAARSHALVRHAVLFGISKPLRAARPTGARRLPAAMPGPTVNVPGQSYGCCSPSDANGAAGPTRYVQVVDTTIAVYDKSGGVIQAAASLHTIWSALTDHGNPCYASDAGDPIVLYDHLANRWLVAQLGFANMTTGPYYECVAVSRTGDPTGSWYAWAFRAPTYLGDYPKLAVWPDAYTMSVNQFTESPSEAFKGAGVVAFDRTALLAGSPGARMAYVDTFPTNGTSLASMLPADWDGATPPPTGAPDYFVQLDTSQLELWELHVDWSPATPTASLTHLTNLGVSAYTPACLSGSTITSCIAQKGTGQGLEPMSDRLMYRLQYRNFGDHQSLVLSHTVGTGSNVAGIRWYELRGTPADSWSVYQQGTYAPGDGVSRWMGSAAMDSAGDIALGFSASGSATFPDVRYVGRLAGDPSSTLPQTEVAALTGTASQTSTDRWGDYSSMSLDPTDDCTFWYTQQYVASGGDWTTRILSFRFPSCTGGSTVLPVSVTAPTISGTPSTGQTLRATDGTWTGAQPVTATAYHWQQCDAGGASCATSSHDTATTSYVLDSSDIGHVIRVAVTRTNELGSGTGTSAATVVVAAASTAASGGGGGRGTAGGGGVPPDLHVDLTASAGGARGAGSQLLYFVKVSVTNVGASSSVRLELTLPAGYAVTRTYSDRGAGCTGTVPTLTCDVAWIAPGTSTNVTIWGTVAVAGELDATAAVTSLVETEANPADNTTTLKLLPAPTSGGRGGGGTSSPAPPVTVKPPAVRGTPVVGATLYVTAPVFSSRLSRVFYRWQLCAPKRCTPIRRATRRTLKLVAAYAGRAVRVVATATIGSEKVTTTSRKVAVWNR